MFIIEQVFYLTITNSHNYVQVLQEYILILKNNTFYLKIGFIFKSIIVEYRQHIK